MSIFIKVNEIIVAIQPSRLVELQFTPNLKSTIHCVWLFGDWQRSDLGSRFSGSRRNERPGVALFER